MRAVNRLPKCIIDCTSAGIDAAILVWPQVLQEIAVIEEERIEPHESASSSCSSNEEGPGFIITALKCVLATRQ